MRVSIAIPSNEIYGAEGRFIETALVLHQRAADLRVRLVTTKRLFRHITRRYRIPRDLEVITFPVRRFLFFSLFVFLLDLKETLLLKREKIWHFVISSSPVIRPTQRVVLSLVASSTYYYRETGKKNRFVSRYGIRHASAIDLLEPSLQAYVATEAYERPAIHLTPGTIVRSDHRQTEWERRNTVSLCFAGRWELPDTKNVLVFLDALTDAFNRRPELAPRIDTIYVLGSGDGTTLVHEKIHVLQSMHPVHIVSGYAKDIAIALRQSAFFFSLQRFTNYPSRSLAEAMVAGCIPIYNKSGSSERMFAEGTPRYGIPSEFSIIELSDTIAKTVSMPLDEINKQSKKVYTFAHKEFDAEKYVSYFRNMYKSVRRNATK